jgi:hypothetical protein
MRLIALGDPAEKLRLMETLIRVLEEGKGDSVKMSNTIKLMNASFGMKTIASLIARDSAYRFLAMKIVMAALSVNKSALSVHFTPPVVYSVVEFSDLNVIVGDLTHTDREVVGNCLSLISVLVSEDKKAQSALRDLNILSHLCELGMIPITLRFLFCMCLFLLTLFIVYRNFQPCQLASKL